MARRAKALPPLLLTTRSISSDGTALTPFSRVRRMRSDWARVSGPSSRAESCSHAG